MTREDFVERGVRKVDFMAHYGIVSRFICKNYKLKMADFQLLCYLDPIRFFTLDDFKDGSFFYTWDKHRLLRLGQEGWIERFHKANKKGDHNKYRLTYKANRMVDRSYKMLIEKEEIPESRRNKIMAGKTYSDKVCRAGIKKFNRKKTLT